MSITASSPRSAAFQYGAKLIPLALAAIAIGLLLYPLVGSTYIAHLAVITACFALVAVSLDFVLGSTGLFSIAHAALFGVGAYTLAIFTSRLGWPFWPAMLAGGVTAAVLAGCIGLLFARVRGSYLAIGTFAFGELVRVLINQWRDVTGGPMGLSIPARPTIELGDFRLTFTDERSYYGLLLVVGIVIVLAVRAVLASRFGTRMTMVRDDPELAASVGVPVLRIKVTALLISGFIAGVVGGFYAAYLQFISPVTFASSLSIQLVMIVLIGGAGMLLGPLIGTALIILLPQILRVDPTWSLVVSGVLFIVLVLTLPKGIAGSVLAWWNNRQTRDRGERTPAISRTDDRNAAS